ncbi:MAG: GMC family oxidoreductase N-terminal domain-containing protein [Methanobacteriaceae archaeon]|nr:GMC family oxidoreductase N-terminal domain-containing protein [Methanobacteriaceae archaeon]
MKAIVVGSGAGGATAALELSKNGFDVTILEAGGAFKPFTRFLTWAEPLRRTGLLGSEKTISKLFSPINIIRSEKELALVRGMTTGGSTVISCGNIVRTQRGLEELGLDLNPEFRELEEKIIVRTFPHERWRPVTRKMFYASEELGFKPQKTPKAVDSLKCKSCGLCEMGCASGARWDSRIFLNGALDNGAVLKIKTPVKKIIIENGKAVGVIIESEPGKFIEIRADIIVLAAGGIGTAQILKNSKLPVKDKLWADIVLTLGGISKGAEQLKEPPMVWYSEHKDYILSPYLDIFSHWFHKPWRKVSTNDRVGLMVKLADSERGTVNVDGSVEKEISAHDHKRINKALSQAKKILELAGVSEPYIKGLYNGGHLGGTAPLDGENLDTLKPYGIPDNLWIADLSLVPKSQGMPTILLTAALALRISRKIIQLS